MAASTFAIYTTFVLDMKTRNASVMTFALSCVPLCTRRKMDKEAQQNRQFLLF